jgi:hypothetical protein
MVCITVWHWMPSFDTTTGLTVILVGTVAATRL